MGQVKIIEIVSIPLSLVPSYVQIFSPAPCFTNCYTHVQALQQDYTNTGPRGRHDDCTSYYGAWHWWRVSVEPASCQLSGQNFEVASTFLENLRTFILWNTGRGGMDGELFLTSTLTLLFISTNKCIYIYIYIQSWPKVGIARAERDGTRAETRFRLSPKRTSLFKSVGASVQSTAGSRGVCISLSNAGYTTFGGGVRVLATLSIRQFPLHFPSRASPCATRFRTSSIE